MNKQDIFKEGLEHKRIIFFYAAIAIAFGYIIYRLFMIQIIQSNEYLERAEDNRTTTISLPTLRGNIYDRNGEVLASNASSFNVTITPALLPTDPGAIEGIYRALSQIVDIPVNNGETNDETVRLFKPCETDLGITQIVFIADTNAPFSPVKIKCDVSQETAMIIQEKSADWPGVDIEVQAVRDYPTGEMTSEIIGFLGPIPATLEEEYRAQGFIPDRDKVGYAGVEFTEQEILSGFNGERTVEVDVAGQEIRDLVSPKEPVLGNDIYLTIDTRLQSAAKAALTTEMSGWNAYFNEIRMNNGVVIAMNPKTGEILSLVSFPTFENNRMARVIPGYYYTQLAEDPTRPLFNKAISAEVPPGSVYKMAAAIGFLNEEVVTPEQTIFDPGKITILQKFTPNDPGVPQDYVCYDEFGHGDVDWLHAVQLSCDVYFYKVSGGYGTEVPQGLGVWYMAEYARALGYGQSTGIELPGEATGLVPDPNWKRRNQGENWATGDTYIASMGQGFVLSTPLQVLVSIGILANDGKYMQPTLIHHVTDADGNMISEFEPKQKWDITKDALITDYDENQLPTGEMRIVEPWVVEMAQQGMRMVVEPGGTAETPFAGMEIPSAGKTGTAEYCDNVAQANNRCQPGNWPTHSWYVGYAPYDNPEIAVVAFVYNGGEGASVAAPIVRRVMDAYFELKEIDTTATGQ